jgi:hypothetical protein
MGREEKGTGKAMNLDIPNEDKVKGITVITSKRKPFAPYHAVVNLKDGSGFVVYANKLLELFFMIQQNLSNLEISNEKS